MVRWLKYGWLFLLPAISIATGAFFWASPQDSLIIYAPVDKTVTREELIVVSGSLRSDRNTRLFINTFEAVVGADGRFSAGIPLRVGKNLLWAKARDGQGEKIAGKQLRVLRLRTFSDLARDYWSKEAVERLATLGLMSGFPDGSFRPNAPLTRRELLNLLAGVDGRPVGGYPDGTTRLDNDVTRMEALAMIVRFAGWPLVRGGQTGYFDLPRDYWGEPYILTAQRHGLLGHVKTSYLEPKERISRGEVAVMLSRLTQVKEMIERLLDFNQGFD